MFRLEDSLKTKTGATFLYRAMTGEEQMSFAVAVRHPDKPAKAIYDVLRACVTGWDGAKNVYGDPMGEYHRDKVAYLSPEDADEVGGAIMALSGLGDEEKKPSSASRSSETTPRSSGVVSVPASKDAIQ